MLNSLLQIAILLLVGFLLMGLPAIALIHLFRKTPRPSENHLILWVTLILLLPGLGAAAYFVFGSLPEKP